MQFPVQWCSSNWRTFDLLVSRLELAFGPPVRAGAIALPTPFVDETGASWRVSIFAASIEPAMQISGAVNPPKSMHPNTRTNRCR